MKFLVDSASPDPTISTDHVFDFDSWADQDKLVADIVYRFKEDLGCFFDEDNQCWKGRKLTLPNSLKEMLHEYNVKKVNENDNLRPLSMFQAKRFRPHHVYQLDPKKQRQCVCDSVSFKL